MPDKWTRVALSCLGFAVGLVISSFVTGEAITTVSERAYYATVATILYALIWEPRPDAG